MPEEMTFVFRGGLASTPQPAPADVVNKGTEERIGDYRVHPVAAMFPLIVGEEFEKFKESIREHGQQQPIIADGDTLLDGRNRLRACVELGIEPKVEPYRGSVDLIGRFILDANMWRRHLPQEQRTIICARVNQWMAERARLRQKQAGKHGGEGGRGNKKTLTTNSGEGFTANRHARETVSQIAASAKTTRYQAEQAVKVLNHAPELAAQVEAGTMKLKDAARAATARKTNQRPTPAPKPRANDDGFQNAMSKAIQAVYKAIVDIGPVIDKYPERHNEVLLELKKQNIAALKELDMITTTYRMV